MRYRPTKLWSALLLAALLAGCGTEAEQASQPLTPSWSGHSASLLDAADEATCSSCHAAAPHYGGAFDGNAQYVANGAVCGDCHAGGDVAANAGILDQYAVSGHGAVTAPAWMTSSDHDWPNSTPCNQCHSTSGFIGKLGGGAPAPVVAGAGQTLSCSACHTNLQTGALRYARQVGVAYLQRTYDATAGSWNPAAPATFPDVAVQNNLCINCHAGRESGESILALADADMVNAGFKNPHYLGAAGMMYAKLAFIDFIDRDTSIIVSGNSSSYGRSLTAREDGGDLTSTHRILGTPAIVGDSHNPTFFVPGNLDGGGPCIVCHMAAVADHTWGIDANAFDNVCSKCHDEEAGTPLTAGNFKELFIEEQAIPFEDAVALALAKLEENFGIVYDGAVYPYFFPVSAPVHEYATAVRNWTTAATADGTTAPGFPPLVASPLSAADAKKLMGACLNIKLMQADPAAYIHARTYARRVLYDTIDWLDDRTVNQSTGTTALAWDPVKYVKGASAYDAATTESAKYLIKYDRSTGVWDIAQERP